MQWRQVGPAGEWYKMIDLAPATHQYKFIIDGQWRHDHTAPTVLDNLGNVNNCITVQAAALAGASPGSGPGAEAKGVSREGGDGEAAPGHDASSQPEGEKRKVDVSRVTSDPYNLGGGNFPNDSYSQVVPPRDELLVHHSASLLLPPQLRLLLPHHHGDQTTMPLSVQMNHVFCHLHPELSIFAMAHRYRDRSVTQLLYKPTGLSRREHNMIPLDGEANGTGLAESQQPPVYRRGTEIRAHSVDVSLQSVRISGTQRQREGGHGNEFVTYLVDSVLLVHGVSTMLRSERRYKHFNLLDQLLRKAFGPIVPQALPAKRAFGNLQPAFVEERRVALEKYLQQCAAIPAIATSSLFCNFVEADLKQRSGAASFEDGEELLHHSLDRVCSKQGHLLKKGRRRASWKRRYFCLCEQEVFYYYTAEMSNPFQPLGVISLQERENTPKSDSQCSLQALDSSPGATPQPRGHSAVFIQPDSSSDAATPRLFCFAVHTPGRTWHLAADSAAERDDWVRALCACGGQLSANSSAVPESPPHSLVPPHLAGRPSGQGDAATGSEQEGGGGTAAAEQPGSEPVQGMLWKRASKVHITQRSEAETGQARDWVSRHFCLLPGEGSIVYKQNASDPLSIVRGLVPLASYERVEPCPGPRENLPFAFRLLPVGGAPDGSFTFAAPNEDERDAWINALSAALVDARAKRAAPTPEVTRRGAPSSGGAADALGMQLATSVSIQ